MLCHSGPFRLAEGAVWFSDSLYWIDITEGHVYRSMGHGHSTRLELGQSVGCVLPARSGDLVVGLREGIALVRFHQGILRWLDRSLAADPQRRFNDGQIDPWGRVWIGSMRDDMRPGSGELHVYHGGALRTARTGLTIPNGLVFCRDRRVMHHVDSPRRVVETFDCLPGTVELGPVRSSFFTPDELGYPDGMCMDAEGMLWIAHWGGGCVSRWDPGSGRMLDRLDLPQANVTSCGFGGGDLGELFITTAADKSACGAVYRCRPGVRGVRVEVAACE